MSAPGLGAGVDAVVIGSGPNGLVAANLLADAGWSVRVLEAEGEPGGSVRSAALTLPGIAHDLFSGFYPLALGSPVMASLGLERHGLEWCHAPSVLAHPFADGNCAVLSRSIEATAASVELFAPGDGQAWHDLYEWWTRVGPGLLGAMCSPFPPVRAPVRAIRALGGDVADFARFAAMPVRSMVTERFRGEGARMLFAGNSLHSDLSPEQAPGALFGWLLTGLAQQVGFPSPRGGPAGLTSALVDRLVARGGSVSCGARVASVTVRGGRATGVVTDVGEVVRAARAVIADVSAPSLYLRLLAPRHVPPRLRARIERFEPDHAAVKLDWALDGEIPWDAEAARSAGTVHVAADLDALSRYGVELAMGLLPARPFLVMGQMTVVDPERAPAGTGAAWAYTHVPHRVRGDAAGRLAGAWPQDGEAFADRMEAEVERLAPGFRSRIRARHVMTPPDMAARNANLADGSVNAGTAQLHQQGPLRPVPGWGRPETPVRGLYLGSASAHPGGGVHGACGANAARVALWRDRLRFSGQFGRSV